MKNASELRAMSVEELKIELLSLLKNQFTMRMKKSNGTLDKTHMVRGVRKAIARLKTIMTEKVGTSNVE